MSTTNEKHTEYAVARGNEVITEWTADRYLADLHLGEVVNGMTAARLEPDVHLVESEVKVTTQRSRAKAVEDPEPEATDPGGDPTGGTIELPASGVWGDNSKPGRRVGRPTQSTETIVGTPITPAGAPTVADVLATTAAAGAAPVGDNGGAGVPVSDAPAGTDAAAGGGSSVVVSTGGEPIADAGALSGEASVEGTGSAK